ncbi:MAG: fibronectin type III domain-containing protein [Clostridia bacterium]|nr:fibronectin type III domain-containing protein [Clostridia bacterium]
MKKIMALFLVVVFSLLTAVTVYANESVTYEVGDVIEFGSYPQTEVKDEKLIDELNALAPEWDEWTSYGYYSGDNKTNSMVQGDWMRCTDVVHGDIKYRGVKFTQYRPAYTYGLPKNTNQKANGYYIDTVYWFSFEPIRWKVIDPEIGLVMCENLIDSQAFNDTVYYTGGVFSQSYKDPEHTIPANDYDTSSIRKWLNEDFLNVAFSESEKREINTTICEISDKVFLLTYDDVLKSEYGFNTDRAAADIARMGKGSDYAKCQGIGIDDAYEIMYYGNSSWLLRTKDGYYCKAVDCEGKAWLKSMVCSTSCGIRPALTLNNIADFEKAQHIHSYYSGVAEKSDCAKEGVMKFICLCGDTYTEPVAKLPHEYKTEIEEATDTKDGWYKVVCKNCGYIEDEGIYYRIETIKLKKSEYTYDGKQKTPEVVVTDRMGNVIDEKENYAVNFKDAERKLPGKYTVKVDFVDGNYFSDTKELYFSILPSKTSKITATPSTSSIKLSWKKVTGADGNRVYQYNSKTGKYKTVKTLTGTSYTVKNLKAGTSYKFAVKAYTKDGDETLWAASSRTITTATKPVTPIVKATAGSGKVTLSWSKVSGATGYVIYMQNTSGDYEKLGSTKSTSYVKKSLKKGKTYKFRVKAYKKVDGKYIYSGYKTYSVKVK